MQTILQVEECIGIGAIGGLKKRQRALIAMVAKIKHYSHNYSVIDK